MAEKRSNAASCLAQQLKHSVYNRVIASSSLLIAILTVSALLIPGVAVYSGTSVLLR